MDNKNKYVDRQRMWFIVFIISISLNMVLDVWGFIFGIISIITFIGFGYNWLKGVNYQQKSRQKEFEDLLNDIKEHAKRFEKQSYSYNYKTGYSYKGEYNRTTNTNTLTSKKVIDAFSLLKLSIDTKPDEIKKEYRKLVLKWHPDKWSTDSQENQKIAERNFKKLNNAYNLIKQYKNIK